MVTQETVTKSEFEDSWDEINTDDMTPEQITDAKRIYKIIVAIRDALHGLNLIDGAEVRAQLPEIFDYANVGVDVKLVVSVD